MRILLRPPFILESISDSRADIKLYYSLLLLTGFTCFTYTTTDYTSADILYCCMVVLLVLEVQRAAQQYNTTDYTTADTL